MRRGYTIRRVKFIRGGRHKAMYKYIYIYIYTRIKLIESSHGWDSLNFLSKLVS